MTGTEDKSAPPADDVNAEPTKLSMTQEDLNNLMGKVRTESKTQSDKEIAKLKAEYDEKLRLAALKEEDRVKAEREAESKRLNDELASARRELAMKSAESELVKNGLDAELAEIVLGKDEDETKKNIAGLKKQVDAMVKKQLDDRIKTGAPPKGIGAAVFQDP